MTSSSGSEAFTAWTTYFEGFYFRTNLKDAKEEDGDTDRNLALRRGTFPLPSVFVVPLPHGTSRPATNTGDAIRPHLPDTFFSLHLYGMTGWDPKGTVATPEDNAAANRRLKEKLVADPDVGALWRAVGFTPPPSNTHSPDTTDTGDKFVGWQLEHGFLLGIQSPSKPDATAKAVDIARTFGQGAIFGYALETDPTAGGQGFRLLRQTVPVLASCEDETIEILLTLQSPV
ncbi:hypothetical protein HDU96_000072, partial [Phlyctochytrium bullatum]